jgi:hypothetical protein
MSKKTKVSKQQRSNKDHPRKGGRRDMAEGRKEGR